MSVVTWLYGVNKVKYACPYHGVVEVQMPNAAGYVDRVRCPTPVRVTGISTGGSGPDHGHDTLCGLQAVLVTS